MNKWDGIEVADKDYKNAVKLFGLSATDLSESMKNMLTYWYDGHISRAKLCEEFMVKLYKENSKPKYKRNRRHRWLRDCTK